MKETGLICYIFFLNSNLQDFRNYLKPFEISLVCGSNFYWFMKIYDLVHNIIFSDTYLDTIEMKYIVTNLFVECTMPKNIL